MSEIDSPDILFGAEAISSFLGLPLKAARHRIARGDLPTFRFGSTVCARRKRLLEYFEALESNGTKPVG